MMPVTDSDFKSVTFCRWSESRPGSSEKISTGAKKGAEQHWDNSDSSGAGRKRHCLPKGFPCVGIGTMAKVIATETVTAMARMMVAGMMTVKIGNGHQSFRPCCQTSSHSF